MTITLLGEPKSTSHIYHYHCKFGRPAGYMTAEGKALKEAYQLQAQSQWRGEPLTGPLSLEVTLYFGTRRKADIDNFNKLWADALTGIVFEDDSQIEELRLRKGYDRERLRWTRLVRQFGGLAKVDRVGFYAANFSIISAVA